MIISASLFLISERFRQLLITQNLKISVWDSWKLYLIGHFFNFVLPGGVGGDLIKAYYLKKEKSSQASTSPYTVIFDRIVGLYAMMAMALVTIAIHLDFIFNNPKLTTVAGFVLSVFLLLNLFAIAAFIKPLRNFVQRLIPKRWPKLHSQLANIINGFDFYSKHPWRLAYCLLLSTCGQILTVISLFIIGFAAGFNTPLSAYFFVVPIGFAIAGLPFAPPGGVGAGQAAFLVLFNLYLGEKTSLGPTVITVFQFISLCIGLAGLFFYLTRKKAS